MNNEVQDIIAKDYEYGFTTDVATEIIDRITEQKKKEMGGTNSQAIQK